MSGGKLARAALGLERVSAALILALVLAFLLALTGAAFLQTAVVNTDNPVSGENVVMQADNVFLNLLILSLLMLLLYLFYRHCDEIPAARLEWVLMLWVFALGTAFVASTKLQAPFYSDSYIVTYAAQRAALGDLNQLNAGYFRRFPFQLGYVLYSELFFRAVNPFLKGLPDGYRWLALQETNLLWYMLAMHALLRCARLIWKRSRVEKLCAVLMSVCLPPVFSVTFLYGNIPAFACGALGLWMFAAFCNDGKLRHALLTAVALTLAVVLKLNLLIFCVAVGGVWLVLLLKKPALRSALCLALAAVCVLTASRLPQRFYERRSGLSFGPGIPMVAWMAMGWDEGYAAPGWYREEHTVSSFENHGGDAEATAQEAKAYLAARAGEFARDPKEALRFFWLKLRSQWNEPSYESLWINQVQLSFSEKGKVYDFFCGSGTKRTLAVMKQIQQLVFLGALLGLPRLLKRRELLPCLLPTVLLGGLLYHLLFEAKSQYALPYYVLMLPLAAWGLHRLFRQIEYR